MSYDLQVFARSGLTPTVIAAVVADLGLVWRASVDTWDALDARGVPVCGGDVPVPMEVEGLPEELSGIVREPRWVMSITVEGSGAAGIRVAQKFSREGAEVTGAAGCDQQP